MPDHPIEIFVSQNGVLSYSDRGLTHVGANESVEWICKTHDYAIQFASNAWPFVGPAVPLSKPKGVPTGPYTAKNQGKPGTKFNSFKYTVCAYVPNGPTPIVVDDPIIIVEDG